MTVLDAVDLSNWQVAGRLQSIRRVARRARAPGGEQWADLGELSFEQE